MPFTEIKGQDRVANFLKSALEKGRLHHSYLFIGNQGVGKTLTAKNFAKAINCLNPDKNEPCGNCASCLKIENNQSPDVFFMTGSGENDVFKIEDIKNLQRVIVLKPFESKKKIFILEDVSRMTADASNAFLKTLEEPPKDSVFILIAHDKSKVFSTVYSRCEVIQFTPLSRGVIKDIILRNHSVDNDMADYITYFSEGSLKRSIDFAKLGNIIDWKNKLVDNFTYTFKPYNDDISAFGEKKPEITKTLNVLSFWYRDMIMAKLGLRDLVVNQDRVDELSEKSQSYDIDELTAILGLIEKTFNFINSNVNPKLCMGILKMEIDDICTR